MPIFHSRYELSNFFSSNGYSKLPQDQKNRCFNIYDGLVNDLIRDGVIEVTWQQIMDRAANPGPASYRWRVDTHDADGRRYNRSEIALRTEEEARRELSEDHRYRHGWSRRLMRATVDEWGERISDWEQVDERVITRKLIEPVTLAGSAKRALRQWSQQGCRVSAWILGGHTRNDRVDFIAMRGGMMSYLPDGKPHRTNDDGTWKRDGRQEGKPGKIVRQFLNDHALGRLTDRDIELFANNVKSESEFEDGAITIVEGEAIVAWYNQESYSPNVRMLNGSCMRYPNKQDAARYYAENPETCKLAILTDPKTGLLVARALVWVDMDGNTLMDRVYADESVSPRFAAYAEEQGWHRRIGSGYSLTFVRPGQTRSEPRIIKVSMHGTDYTVRDNWPYIDSFPYYNFEQKFITNNQTVEHHAERNYQTANGIARINPRKWLYERYERIDWPENPSGEFLWTTPPPPIPGMENRHPAKPLFSDACRCHECDTYIPEDEGYIAKGVSRYGDDRWYCEACYVGRFDQCRICKAHLRTADVQHLIDGRVVCQHCKASQEFTCACCGEVKVVDGCQYIYDKHVYYCRECANEKYDLCPRCHSHVEKGGVEDGSCRWCRANDAADVIDIDEDHGWEDDDV